MWKTYAPTKQLVLVRNPHFKQWSADAQPNGNPDEIVQKIGLQPEAQVTAVENTHFRFEPGTPAYGKYKSFSYRFDTLDRSFLFTGDTGWSDAVIDLAKGADVLVTEVTSTDDVIGLMKRNGVWQAKTESEQEGWLRHMHEEHVTPEEVGRFAAQAGVKTVVMTHLSPSPDPNDDFARYAVAAKKHFSGSVLIAKDLMKF